MRINARTITLLLTGAVAAAASFVVFGTGTGFHMGSWPVPSSQGTKDNPNARMDWELMRLRDPATGVIPAGIRRRELAYASTIPTREAYNRVMAKSMSGPVVSSWQHRGPYNVGGRTRALAIDVENEQIMLAGGVAGGMWRTTNGGQNWSRRTDPGDLPSVTCVTQDVRPGKRNIWYYGTGEGFGFSASRSGAGFYLGDGIFKSTDGGLTWRQLQSTVTGKPQVIDQSFDAVWRIAVDPSNTEQDEVYAAVQGGIMRSVDGGETWTSVLGGLSNFAPFTEVAVTSTGVVYATLSSEGSIGGLFRSENGIDWIEITPAGWPAVFRRIGLAVAPSNQDVVYFLGVTPGAGFQATGGPGNPEWHSLWKYTYVSGDGTGTGGTWNNLSANLPAFGGPIGDFRSQTGYDLMIKVHPQQDSIVYVGGTNLYRSTDGFSTASKTEWIGGYNPYIQSFGEYPAHHPDQHDLVFLPSNPSIMINANDGGLYRTENGLADSVAWKPLNNGYSVTMFYTVGIDHGTPGSTVMVGGTQDNGTWLTTASDPMEPWFQIGGGDGSFCAVADGLKAIYLSSQQGVVFKHLFDSAFNFMGMARVDPQGGGGYVFVNPFVLDPLNNDIMYMAVGSSVWRNSDLKGLELENFEPTLTNWAPLNSSNMPGTTVTAIGLSKANPGHRLYYGTSNGRVFMMNNAHQNQPGVREVTGPDFPSNSYVSCIAVDPTDGNRALVVFSNYNVQSLFYTEDGGENWSAVGGNLEQFPDGTGAGPSCRWASILNRGGEPIIFLGTSTGVYSATQMEGSSTVWAQEGAATIGRVIVNMITTRQSDGLVVVGTHANGVYTAAVGASGVDDREKGGSLLELAQNVPNPARGTTRVDFTVPAGRGDATARLALHDVAGREVYAPLERRLPAGRHTVDIDLGAAPGGRLPEGVYYYRLTVGDLSAVRKMIVTR